MPDSSRSATTQPAELKVFILTRESKCGDCGSTLARSAWVQLAGDKGALCLPCADLDHLEFLPRGDAALTRRARKLSALGAVVLKWSRARKRYERQGILVEAKALEEAETSCLADADARTARATRRAEHEAEVDERYVRDFADAIRRLFPACPHDREFEIARHACLKYSGRIGRTQDAKSLEPAAVELAVRAHVRHRESRYDQLLGQGVERLEARRLVQSSVERVLDEWRKGA